MADSAALSLPAVLAQRQLDAYNAHDVDAFCACYADDVEVFTLPSMERTLVGRAALRERYAPYFASRRPHATLSSKRLVLGAMSIDPEDVRFVDDERLQAIALYHVEDRGAGPLIQRVWFIRA